jgi:hypothetical protein
VAFFILPAASAPAGIVPARCYRRHDFLLFLDQAKDPIKETHYSSGLKDLTKWNENIKKEGQDFDRITGLTGFYKAFIRRYPVIPSK